jgi:cyclopropane fatty-acyl-phospholipid synthase-like methyltransferase
LSKDFRNSLYEDYAESFKNSTGRFDFVAADKWAPCFKYYLRKWLPVAKDARIIDLGCGEGRVIYLLQQMGYTNVEGVDISKSQLKIAQQVSENVTQADILKHLKDSTKKYDLILSFDVIEHLQKSEALEFLELCHTQLNDHGRLILQTPNASSPFFGDVRYGDFTHELSFTPRLLTQLVYRTGFEGAEARETGPIPKGYSIKSHLRAIIWQLIRGIFRFFETIETGGCANRIYTRVFLLSALKKND